MNLYEQLIKVTGLIHPEPYLLIGGMAYSVYAEPRFTEDIDLMISRQHTDNILQQMNRAGFINQLKPWGFEKAVIQRSVWVEGQESCIIDFLIEPEDTFKIYYDRREIVEFQGFQISVIHPEDLIELKSRRNSFQDKMDMEQLLKRIQS